MLQYICFTLDELDNIYILYQLTWNCQGNFKESVVIFKIFLKVTCFKKKNVFLKPLINKDAGRDWGQEEKEMTEDEMAGWHH